MRKQSIKVSFGFLTTFILIILFISCNDDNPTNPGTPGEFGLKTSLVVVVNPIINQGSSTTIEPGTQRSGIPIKAGSLAAVNTSSTGLAVITDLSVNPALPVIFPGDTTYINVVQEKELYDYVVSYKNGVIEEIFPAVRYTIGGQVVILDSTNNINDYVNQDNAIIVLKPGKYSGNINITARNVLIFGSASDDGEALSIVQGTVSISGEAARIRGLNIHNTLTVNANNFEAAFCKMNSANIHGNNILLLRNIFTVGQATVSSSNAILVDNIGIP